MLKYIIVTFALFANALAAPGYLSGHSAYLGGYAHAAPALSYGHSYGHAYAAAPAISYSAPIAKYGATTHYAAPAIAHHAYAAPAHYAAPAYAHAAYAPAHAIHAAPLLSYGFHHHAPALGHGW